MTKLQELKDKIVAAAINILDTDGTSMIRDGKIIHRKFLMAHPQRPTIAGLLLNAIVNMNSDDNANFGNTIFPALNKTAGPDWFVTPTLIKPLGAQHGGYIWDDALFQRYKEDGSLVYIITSTTAAYIEHLIDGKFGINEKDQSSFSFGESQVIEISKILSVHYDPIYQARLKEIEEEKRKAATATESETTPSTELLMMALDKKPETTDPLGGNLADAIDALDLDAAEQTAAAKAKQGGEVLAADDDCGDACKI